MFPAASRPVSHFRRLVVCLACVGSLSVATSARGRVWLVDDGPTAAQFTTIQAAVDAAADGDVILVRPGTYGGFQIGDKALGIVAEKSGTVQLIDYFDPVPAIRVTGLAAGKRVVIRGLYARRIHGIDDDEHTTVYLLDNEGLVLFEDCNLRGTGSSDAIASGRALRARTCAAVVASRSQLFGGLYALFSDVSLFDCELQGPDGADCSGFTSGATVGRPGMRLVGGQTLVSGSFVQGGQGGNGSTFYGCCDRAGGPGVLLDTSAPVLSVLDSTLLAGPKGTGNDCGVLPVPPVYVVTGTEVALPGVAHTGGAHAWTYPGAPLRLFDHGLAGDLLFVGYSFATKPLFLPGLGGTLVPDLAALGILPLGVLGADELLTDLPFAGLPVGLQGLELYTQSLALGAGGSGVLGPPSAAALVDLQHPSAGGADCDGDGTADLWEILMQDLADDDADGIPNECDPYLVIHVDNSGPVDPLEDGSAAHPFDTIAEGILAAPLGSYVVVLVEPGTYTGPGNRNLDFGGRDLCVRSAQGAALTTIDCGGLGRAFVFHSGESSGAVVDGFTITGGKALEGGAILVTDSDPVIRHCTFRGNRAEGSFQARGGALAGMDTRLGLFDCTFETNSSTYSGGAVYFDSDLSYPSGSAPDPPLVVDCLFTGNLAKIGGALSQGSSIDGLQLAGSRFVGNLATSTGGALSLNGTVWIESCHFAGNRAEGAGGAIYTGGFFANVSLLGSTLRANASATGGGGLCATGYSTTLRSSIFWSNSADDPLAPQELWSAAFYNPGVLDVSYCTVAGGQAGVGLEVASQLEWGPGNLQVDPRFLSAIASDPHLSNSSPCIEAAEPTWVPSMFDRDIDGGPRRVGAVVDMGADETTP